MPKADLRLRGDVLDPLAPVKMLAVMCHPADARGREGMLRSRSNRITVSRSQGLKDLAGNFRLHHPSEEFLAHRRQGCLAGSLVLVLAQLRAMNHPGEAGFVLAQTAAIARQWAQAMGMEEGPAAQAQEADILAAYRAYASVSHLWAALVYGALLKLREIQPYSAGTLPTFLAYAEEIARLARSVTWVGGVSDLALDAKALWTFVLPSRLQKTAKTRIAQVTPLHAPTPGPAHPGDLKAEGQ